MFRYVALLWDPTKPERQHAADAMLSRLTTSADDWRIAYRTTGTCVLCTGERRDRSECHVLQPQGGIVLGTIFERNGTAQRVADFDPVTSIRIVDTAGGALIDNYWGSYVAIVTHNRSNATSILRSPLGNLPCLTAAAHGVQLFFSYLPDCIRLGTLNLSIDWDYVACHLLKVYLDSNQTGLKEVTAVPAGHCARIQADNKTTGVYWDPRRVSQNEPITQETEAVEIVRSTTLACVRAWSSRHEIVLHKLSGGLDSSIVLGCLQQARPSASMTTLTFFGPDAASCDEREYARLAARHAGSELVESYIDPHVDLSLALNDSASEKPPSYRGRVSCAPIERELARSKNATAIFSGDAGDEIFLRSSRLASADYVTTRGLDRHLIDALLHRAEMESISFWKAAREALYNGWFVRELDVLKGRNKLQNHVSEKLIDKLRKNSRRGVSSSHRDIRVPLGKQYQILHALAPAPYYLPLAKAGDPEPVTPLASQPLVEACLRIPTYVLTQGGWDRAIARRAFAATVPAEIIHRRTKGGGEETAMQILQSNAELARSMLLDGNLVRRNLLDRSKLEDALSDRPSVELKAPVPVLRYLSMELWLSVLQRHGVALAS